VETDFARHYYEVASEDHWWFKGRKKLITELLSRVGLGKGPALDVGAGSTTMIPDELATVRLDVVIPSPSGDDRFVRASALRLPMRSRTFSLVGLFDVIEHIADVPKLLEEVDRVLASEGWVIVTVPAHQWLWSKHDDQAHHFRRYSPSGLVDQFERLGFRVHWCGQFYGFLVFPALMRKLLGLKSGMGLPRPAFNDFLSRLAERSARKSLRQSRLGLSIGMLASRPAPST
jgi:SAM-dependent methyltransferase